MTDWINQCHFGDVRDVLRQMIADGVKVQTTVTSPPYWGLRDYGHPDQLGLEATPELYVANMVEVFNLVRDLTEDNGTLWLNLGDSYAANRGSGASGIGAKQATNTGANLGKLKVPAGLKEKDLVGIPWMVAFALRASGWYLRQEIIWNKPNPMPESVTDRCTKSHETLFLLAKSSSYYCDMGAISEAVTESTLARLAQDIESQYGSDRVPGKTNGPMKAVGGSRAKRDSFKRENSKRAEAIPGQTVGTHREDCEESSYDTGRRNKRSVWTVATKPYKGAHFATFPTELIEPCVLAGAPAGGIVLDTFFGSGTTGQVAQQLGRKFVGIELNTDYKALQAERLRQPSLDLEAA
jgi:DNA modification methylase